MRRAIGPVAIVLALVTGIVLAETRRVAFMSAVVRDSDPPAGINTGVIRRFYAAVNELLATGDDAAFTAAVDAELIEHPARAGVSPNRDGFVRALIALRAIAPNLQLVALDVVAQGDRVVARVAVEGGEGAKFLGRPLAADRLWGAVDLFRIEADRVVEHWSASTETALLEPLATLTVPTADPTHRVVTLERWTYAPDTSERRSTDWSSLLIFVDEGTLTITIDGLESSAARPVQGGRIGTAPNWGAPPFGTPQTLRPGDALLAPDATTFTASNGGAIPAVAYVVGLTTPAPQWRPTVPTFGATSVVSHQVLAGGMTVVLPADGATIEIGRATLTGGDRLPSHPAEFAELVAVEAGQLTLSAQDGGTWIMANPNAGAMRTDGATVSAGGAFIDAESAIGSYAAKSDETVLVLAIVSVASV